MYSFFKKIKKIDSFSFIWLSFGVLVFGFYSYGLYVGVLQSQELDVSSSTPVDIPVAMPLTRLELLMASTTLDRSQVESVLLFENSNRAVTERLDSIISELKKLNAK